MKLKLKLNGAGLKALAMQHGEKAGFGLGALLLLWFVWSATKTTVLGPEKQPGPLRESAAKTDEHIRTSKWDPKAKGIEVVDYVSRAKRDPLNDKDYRLVTYLIKPLWESKGKRPDPKMLPVEELLATAGVGVFALAPPEDEEPVPGKKPKRTGPGGPMDGRMGAMPGMPGAPPAKGKKGKDGEQAVAPAKKKRPNRNADLVEHGVRVNSKSILKGYSYVVVTGLVPIRKQEAEFEEAFSHVILSDPEMDVPDYSGLKIEREELPNDSREPTVREIKAKDLLTFMETWGADAKEVIDEAYVDPRYTMPLAPLVGVDWDAATAGHSKIPEAPKRDAKKAKVKVADDEGGDDEDVVIAAHKKRVNFGAEPPLAERRKRGASASGQRRPQTDLTLFRFIDNTVEPGKRYRYRVKLRLKNPNLGKAEKYLKNPASHKISDVYSDWSEMTPVVTIPPDIDIYAGAVVAKTSTPKEPQMKVCVVKLDRDRGLKLITDEAFGRGQLITIRKSIEVTPPGSVDAIPITLENAVLETDAVVVDIQGGRPLKGPKSPIAPAEMLILKPDGSLVVQDELADEATYRTLLPSDTDVVTDDGGILPGDPYQGMNKGKDGTKKSKRELKAEARKKKKAAQ